MKRKIDIIIALFLGMTGVMQATDFVVISEILYDSPLNENPAQTPYCFGEFIELYNASIEPANLTGWQLTVPKSGQSYTFPEVVLAPQSFLIVAFGEPVTYAGYIDQYMIADGWTDFHALFDIEPETGMILFQTQMTLPNDTCTLTLKDNTGTTRDYARYGGSPTSNSMLANNNNCAGINAFWATPSGINSIQRISIIFDLQGCTSFHEYNWIGGVGEYDRDPSYGQNSPMSSDFPVYANIISPDLPNALMRNYIVTVTPTVEMDSIPVVNNEMQLNNLEALVKIDYFDGLGRPLQTLQKAFTPLKKNLLTYKEYDVYGRSTKDWLPVAVEFDYMDRNQFIAASQLLYPNESRAYTEYKYSTDILSDDVLCDELTGIQVPGADMNNHYAARKTLSNEANTVKCYKINNNTLQKADYYPAKRLLYEQTIDEDGKVSRSYKNKQGKVIMTRQSTNHDTYYVYDDLGNLRYVLPPKASDAMNSNTDYYDSHDALKQYAYIYKYDDRGNQTYKRLPGCEPIYMVYDKANRLILSQDGNQRNRTPKQWTVNKYDNFGRLLYTGLINREITQAEKTQINNTVVVESFVYSGFQGTGYTCTYFANEVSLLTVNYYDNYNFLEIWPGTITNDLVYQEKNSYGTAYAAYPIFGDEAGCKNFLTGTINRIVGTNNFLYRIDYYDDRGRVVQTRSTNHMGGYDFTYNAYDFIGNVIKNLKEHSITGQDVLTESYTYTYDHALRLKTTKYKLNDNDTVLLASNQYDDFGRLTEKKRHNYTDTDSIKYNIRNWITKIKSGTTFEENLYYNTLLPNNPSAMACYNGNISAYTWKYNNTINGYTCFYDHLNRLYNSYVILNNQFNDFYYSEFFWYDKMGNILSIARFDNQDSMDQLQMTYNGNQLTKVRDIGISQDLNSIKEYQDLSDLAVEFYYDTNGNMTTDSDRNIVTIRYNLLNLPDTIQFGNGNQILNKYSADGQKLSTTYITAPLNVVVPINSTVNSQGSNYTRYGTKYCGNIEYEFNNVGNTSLKRVNNDEGYVDFEPGGGDPMFYFDDRYNYYRKDHLGNVREVWRAPYSVHYMDGGGWGQEVFPAQTVQRTQYYPSGLPWKSNTTGDNPGEQAYKFNGCEFVEMHGYDVTDLGNRGVHHATNRFTTMDRFCEKFPWQSPYVFAGNNPVNYVDVNGDSIWIEYDDENGHQQRILYTQGMKYEGNITIVGQQTNSLNAMNSTKNGATVLSTLSSSTNHFNLTNGQSVNGTAGFLENNSGGGTLLMNNSNDLLNISHEMFHAFQYENGQGGGSIFNELEAYLFSDAVNLEFNNGKGSAGSYSQGQSSSTDATMYSKASKALLFNSVFSIQSFNIAVNLFKNNSGANSSGRYNNLPLRRSNQTQNLIKQFYPLY